MDRLKLYILWYCKIPVKTLLVITNKKDNLVNISILLKISILIYIRVYFN